MPLPPAGQQRPGRLAAPSAGTPAISRRRLIAAAALMAGVGVTDAACGATRKGQAALRATQLKPRSRPSKGAAPRRTRAVLADQPAPRPSHATPTHSHPASPSHGHEGHSRHRVVEKVTLPPAKTRVRSRPAYYVDEIVKHPPRHAVGLTIDDGPDPDWTPKVLRLLDKYQMKATFCVVGIHADAYPRLVRDIHRAGHALVNHSYTHIQPFATQSEARIVSEITRTQRAIERAAHVTPQLFRSPGGDWSHFVFRACAAYDLAPLDWDIDPMDWARPGVTKIRTRMLHARPNDIVLCHDGGGNRAETVRALRKVLPTWRRRGYTVIPLVLPQPAAPRQQPRTSPTASAPAPTPTQTATS